MAKTYAIYFIQCDGPERPVKIGYAADVPYRLINLQTGCPYSLRVIAEIVVLDHREEEAILHRRFRAHAIRGEWFRGHPDVLAAAEEARRLHGARVAAVHGQIFHDGPPAELAQHWNFQPRPELPPTELELEVAEVIGNIKARRPAVQSKPRMRRGQFMWRGQVRG